ncbi:hypothetical protein FCOIX_681 [Fusarium coicis]|nr:hypothetical protein FCOIX_681 [Fusarium coicis]
MSIGEVANRAANSIIAGPEDLSEQEKHSFHDLLQECLWDSDDHIITMPVLNVKKLKATSVGAGYFITNLPVTPSKSEFEPNSQGKDFETCWKDECGLTVSSEFVRFKYGVTKAKAIVNLNKAYRLESDEEEEEITIDWATRLRLDKQKPPRDLSHFVPNGQIVINAANVRRFNDKCVMNVLQRLKVEDITTKFLRNVPDVFKSVLGADNLSPTDLLYLPLVDGSFKLWGVYIDIAIQVDTDEVTGIYVGSSVAYKTYIEINGRVQHHERQSLREYDSVPAYKRSQHYQAMYQDDVEPDFRLLSLFEVTPGN